MADWTYLNDTDINFFIRYIKFMIIVFILNLINFNNKGL